MEGISHFLKHRAQFFEMQLLPPPPKKDGVYSYFIANNVQPVHSHSLLIRNSCSSHKVSKSKSKAIPVTGRGGL
jgi:hypothetical protein